MIQALELRKPVPARGRRYHYYVCRGARLQPSNPCSRSRVPAPRIEQSVREQIQTLAKKSDCQEVRNLLSSFGPQWTSLSKDDQSRRMQSMIERVTYDGTTGRVAIRLHKEKQDHA